jgi:hypothetical protein
MCFLAVRNDFLRFGVSGTSGFLEFSMYLKAFIVGVLRYLVRALHVALAICLFDLFVSFVVDLLI